MFFDPEISNSDDPGKEPRGSKRVVFFGLNYSPEMVGIGPYTAGLAEMLVDAGHDIEVVTGHRYYPEWKLSSPPGNGWRRETINGVLVHRCPIYVPRKPSAARRLMHYASFAASAFWPLTNLLFRKRTNVVFAVAPSLIACLTALFLGKLFRVPVWLHLQDFEVEMAFATRFMRPDGVFAKIARATEQFVLRRADLVSTISPKMLEKLEAKGVEPARRLQLRNWANHAEAIGSANCKELVSKLGLEGRAIALYSGNIGAKQGLENVIEAAERLHRRTDIAFVICGGGNTLESLKKGAVGLNNVRFLPMQNRDRFAQLMRLADIHLLPQTAEVADLVLPSKLPNMLASAAPVIATAREGTGIADEIEGCGIVVPPDEPIALAEAIERLADDPQLRQKLGSVGFRRSAARWSAQNALRSFQEGLARLESAATNRNRTAGNTGNTTASSLDRR